MPDRQDARSAALSELDRAERAGEPVPGWATLVERAKAPRSLVGRCTEALRKITEGSPEVVEEGLVEARRILEGPHFDCPACGRSFKVGSETSERIFCSPRCRDAR